MIRKLLSLALLAALAFATPADAQGPVALGNFRNLLVGGDVGADAFQGGTTSVTGINTTGTYFADNSYAFSNNAGASVTLSRQTAAPDVSTGYRASVRVQRAAANANLTPVVYGQILESPLAIQLQGQQVVLSAICAAGANFSAASSQIGLQIVTGTGTDEGLATRISGWTGASTLAANTGSTILQTIGTTLGRVQTAYTIPATATEIAAEITYTPVGTAGTNDWFECEHWQLEVVPTPPSGFPVQATAPERRPLGVELLLAERYVFVLADGAATRRFGCMGHSTTTTNTNFGCPLPVQMRAIPTTTVSVTASFAATQAAGTADNCTTMAGIATSNTVNSIGLACTTAANQVAGNASQLIGQATAGLITVSARE